MEKRMQTLKLLNISHIAIAICVVLIFLNWLMPYFRYAPVKEKQTKTQNSMWGQILFPYNFMQLETVMDEAIDGNSGENNFKYISLRHIGDPVIMMVTGIVILCTITKKGIFSSVIPLIMSIFGIKGYFFGKLIPPFANVAAGKYIGMVLVIILTLATLAKIYFNIQEIKTRPADYYLPSLH
ncbi:MAG: hypothetical protein GX942_04450 [Papillibacter sp.]|nr:hypothetical protein [Papillibacter sp.]